MSIRPRLLSAILALSVAGQAAAAAASDEADVVRAGFQHLYAERYFDEGVCVGDGVGSTAEKLQALFKSRYYGVPSEAHPTFGEALQQVLSGAERPAVDAQVSHALGDRFSAVGTDGCRQNWTVSAPAIAGRFAFVNIDMDCGPMCGFGALMVFERVGESWIHVGNCSDWIA